MNICDEGKDDTGRFEEWLIPFSLKLLLDDELMCFWLDKARVIIDVRIVPTI